MCIFICMEFRQVIAFEPCPEATFVATSITSGKSSPASGSGGSGAESGGSSSDSSPGAARPSPPPGYVPPRPPPSRPFAKELNDYRSYAQIIEDYPGDLKIKEKIAYWRRSAQRKMEFDNLAEELSVMIMCVYVYIYITHTHTHTHTHR